MNRFQLVLALALVASSYATVSSNTCTEGGTSTAGCSAQYDASTVNSGTTIECCATNCSSGATDCTGYCSGNSDGTCDSGYSSICGTTTWNSTAGSYYTVLCSECSDYSGYNTSCYGDCQTTSYCDSVSALISALAGWIIAVIVISCIVVFGIPIMICICCCCCCAAAADQNKQQDMGPASNMNSA